MASKINRVRECTYNQKWHGFNMKPGYLYGTTASPDECFVWTGGVRDKRRKDGSVCGKEVKVFLSVPPKHWEQVRPVDWYPVWISATSGIGKKILERSMKAQKIVPDYRPADRSPNGFYFKSDKSRYPTYQTDAYKYRNN